MSNSGPVSVGCVEGPNLLSAVAWAELLNLSEPRLLIYKVWIAAV